MPLFHSNSTGNLGNTTDSQQQQYQQLTDFDIMGGGGTSSSSCASSPISLLTPSAEVNVAYDGTFGDLGAAEDAEMFNTTMPEGFDFDLKSLLADAAGSRQMTDFTPINNGGQGPGTTVSPKDVFNTDSVPPSTSFTNLTTPGSTYLETPDEDYQTSPLFSDTLGAYGSTQTDNWFPLFPDADAGATPAPAMERTTSASSAAQVMVHPGGDSLFRKRSSTTTSPTFSPVVKHSSVAGVAARKRDKPLPPIMVDEADTVAMKRARNTAAARKSRAKKVAERDELEAEIADLKTQVEYWKARASGLSVDE